MITKKAGCILINDTQVGLIYRSGRMDYSFAKATMLNTDDMQQIAITAVNHETNRRCEILNDTPIITSYRDTDGTDIDTYLYIARDLGPLAGEPLCGYELHWIDVDKVDNMLSYDNLTSAWSLAKDMVTDILSPIAPQK